MRATELRIGNLYIGYSGSTCEVDLELFELLKDGVELDEIIKTPIDITEEWLENSGFQLLTEKRVGTKYSEYGNGQIHYEKRFNLAKHSEKDYWYCLRGSVKIQYVHQLQNLYFALTGSELSTDHCKLTTE